MESPLAVLAATERKLILANPMQQLDAGNRDRGMSVALQSSIGRRRRFTPRWPCSTILLRYWRERTVTPSVFDSWPEAHERPDGMPAIRRV
jgi:hypothetical protein